MVRRGISFQTLSLGDGIPAAVRLEISDHHVDALALRGLRLLQHLVGLAHAGCISQKDFEFAARLVRHG